MIRNNRVLHVNRPNPEPRPHSLNPVPPCLCVIFLGIMLISCGTLNTQEERLAPRRSTEEIRLNDIRLEVSRNPVKAIDLIGSFREAYRPIEDVGADGELLSLEKEAQGNLRGLLETAAAEERWDDAASYSRSLANIGAEGDAGGRAFSEADMILAGAKQKLADGSNLGAFLAALQAHELRPLSFSDAVLFLDRAMELKHSVAE